MSSSQVLPPSVRDVLPTIEVFLKGAIAAADALAKLHQAGILHLNIRPQTLRIDPRGEVIELVGAEGLPSMPSALRLPLEALPYVAPEQTGRIDNPIDHRADLYSLGLVLYELRAGTLPFHANDAVGWVHCHIARAPRALVEAAPGTPTAVSDIVMKLLAKAPDERYQSARGLQHDLERCLAEYTARGKIEPFPLGARDVWDQLRGASKLYGRDKEIALLRASVERMAATGTPEVALLGGPSGIGKSAVVRELQKSIGSDRALFLWGKFEQHKRDIPYAPLGQAFEGLVRQLVASTDAELEATRQQLLEALGGNAQLIVDLVPQLELVIGKQPPVPPLPASEARDRFNVTFRSFLDVFTSGERILVLFLDDLQWADFGSLDLLQHVMTRSELRRVLLLGAYRDDEVGASHPLEGMLGAIKGAEVPVSRILVGPLSQVDFVDLVVDLFHCERGEAQPLAALLWTKTGGNPFFATQLLGALRQDHLIQFDTRRWTWWWDVEKIEAKQITHDLVDLVLGRLRRLPSETLDVLRLAATIGNEFTVQLLGTVCDKTPEAVRTLLEPALVDGLLLHRPQGYKFLHDRVMQASYSLIPEDERAGLHLRIGWHLLEATSEEELPGLLFDIVNQLNLGTSRIHASDMRRRVAELNLRAGRKAKAAAAAKSAANYLANGLALLSADCWDSDYTLAYALHLELAESEYLSGRFEEAERVASLIVSRARSHVEQAAAYRLQIQLATAKVDNPRAMEAGLACLRLFGIELPNDPSDGDVLAELEATRQSLGDRAIEALIDLPEMSDPGTIAAMDVLSALYPAAVYLNPNVAHSLIIRMVRLSILYGNAPASMHGYVTLGGILCMRFGRFDEGYRFGKLACSLGERPGFHRYNPETAGVFAALILPWSRHARESLDYYRKGFKFARESGNIIYACSLLLQNVMTLLSMGEPLGAVYEASVSALEFVNAANYSFLADGVVGIQRFIHAMCGDTARLDTFTGDNFDEAAFDTHMQERNVPVMRLWYYIYKLQARFLAHDYVGAREAMEVTAGLMSSGLFNLLEGEFYYYAALTGTALYDGATEDERAKLRDLVSKHESKLRQFAESSPDNFAAKHALVAAEVARIERRAHDAMDLYDQAVRRSRSSGFLRDEALACELGGRFYLSRDFALLPAAYLSASRTCYERWGATGKVRQFDTLYHGLVFEAPEKSAPATSADVEPIDTITATRASEAISSDLGPEKLLATLMRILIEHAGAQRCCLLLPSRDGLSVSAEITMDHEGAHVEIPLSGRPPSAATLPLSVAQYVRRTREKLILDDMTAHTMFASDAYISRAKPRSLLCAPILRRGEVAGILYLENRLIRGAFTPRRLALLEFLSGISLENALLAADLARETAERTQAEKTLRESEERLKRLVESANVVPWEIDRVTGQFTYVGPQAVKMLGYPQDAWYGAGFLGSHVHPDDRESTLLHLVDPSGDDDFDFRMRAADGRILWLHNVVSVRSAEATGEVGGFLFDVTDRKEAEATLKEKLRIIETQQAAIRKLSTPIIEVWEGVLTMPVLGVVDEQRSEQMMTMMLDAVMRTSCQYTIIDLTGADAVDTKTADHIMKIVRAVQLLGAQALVVGIRPDVAQTIVAMGVDLSSIVTLANLREALLLCMKHQRGRRSRA
ncbi:AAA family ATPase [Polyangium sp. y55x31]|uniref:AAA family ATPase n=1 Tax=Polyangium sp. y55x31 TaxID=3042688 RepID=UPI002482FCB3|nr:AAA family ATPase [Polyangium sp. y55x31]MDI1476288.1 AAA family ATPase [Polyangium sp. y55x31]